MNNTANVTALIEELFTASEIYYQKMENSPLSDEEFDAKLAYLQGIEESGEHEELFAAGTRGFLVLEGDPSLGTKVSADEVVKRSHAMLSLSKAQTPEQLLPFLTKTRASGAEDFILQAKIDGFALSAEYHDGKLTVLSTRGDGIEGENLTYLVHSDEVTIEGLPKTLDNHDDIEIRGEVYLSNEQFETVGATRLEIHGGEPYKLNRNALVGIVKKAKKGIGHEAELSFAAYSVLHEGVPADLNTLTPNTFKTVDQLTSEIAVNVTLTGFKDNEGVLAAVKKFGEVRPTFSIPTDGVVIKPTNESIMHSVMGYSSHHPRSQIAFKFPSPTAITEVLGIDLTVGKTGKITPVGRCLTVLLDGSSISNFSLHNFNILYQQNVRVGQTVEIFKANDIIPQVKNVIFTPDDAKLLPVPTNCPVCESTLEVGREEAGVWPPQTLLCKNHDCPSRNFYALKTAVGKNYLDIDGMSDKILTFLNDTGRVTTIADLYTLTFDELKDASFGTTKEGNPVRLGENRAQNIIDHIELSKTKEMPKMVAALAIPTLGRTMTKILMTRFKNIDELLAAKHEDIAVISQLGEVRAANIVSGLKHRGTLIETLRKHGVTFEVNETPAGTHLNGYSFAISGTVPNPFANRNDWVDYIEQHGGEFHSSPKAATTHMVGDPEEGSSKIKKAVKLGLNFLTPEEFTTQFIK